MESISISLGVTFAAMALAYAIIRPFYPCIDCGARWGHRRGCGGI